MERRTILKAAAATAALFAAAPSLLARESAGLRPASFPLDPTLSPLAQAARDGWLYGLALIENAVSRAEFVSRGAPNTIVHDRVLAGWDWKGVTTPNNDTLYSRSWLDLTKGPVRITIPASSDRYLSLAFMDMYMNNFTILGTRTTGETGGSFTVVGPMDETSDPLAIRSPTPWVWTTLRVLVAGPHDLADGHRLQNGFKVEGPKSASPPAYVSRSAPWDRYFESVQRLLIENPPPVTDAALFETLKPLGLGMLGGFDTKRFTATQAKEIELGVAAGRTMLRTAGRQGPIVNGWAYPKTTLGDFGQDYFFRVQVALAGLGALPIIEAMYLRPLNDAGRMGFDSARAWRLTLPGNALPAVDAFWSISMYEETPEGQYFFVKNPIDRYMISDRTPDLKRSPDGSIEIIMTRTPPAKGGNANWLPTPPERPFDLVFRGYLPKDDLLSGRYKMAKPGDIGPA